MQQKAYWLLILGSCAFACGDSGGGGDEQTATTVSTIGTTMTTMGSESSTDPTTPTTGISATETLDSSTSEADMMMCGESEFLLEAVPPNVMLVLDKSKSMILETWDHDENGGTPDVTRWESLFNVVDTVVTTFESEINLGAVLFPSEDALDELDSGACDVEAFPEVPVMDMNANNILSSIPGAMDTDLVGATPATAGVETALEHLKGLDPNVDRFIILITDGAANCAADSDLADCPGIGCDLMENYDDNLQAVVGAAFMDDEIPTFVVGIDILDMLVGVGDDGAVEANTFEELNEVAMAGGRPQAGAEMFFNSTNQAELETALQEIAGQVVSCTIPLDPEPDHPDFVEVEIGGMPVDRVTDCTSEDGWVYVNPDGPYDAIELCGNACGLLAEFGNLDALYGCPPAE